MVKRSLSDDTTKDLFPGTFRHHLDSNHHVLAFLTRVQELAPQVLDDLKVQILPAFQNGLQGNNDRPGFVDSEWNEPDWAEQGIRPMIQQWAKKHHLIPDGRENLVVCEIVTMPPTVTFGEWRLFPTAYSTLFAWATSGIPSRLAWEFLEWVDIRTLFPPEPFKCELILDGWNVFTESITKVRQRFRTEFEKTVTTYLKQIETAAESRCERAPHQFTPVHIDWLVEFQVNGKSFVQIAGEDYDRTNVGNAVRNYAQVLIGSRWSEWLRPGKRGRPRRSS